MGGASRDTGARGKGDIRHRREPAALQRHRERKDGSRVPSGADPALGEPLRERWRAVPLPLKALINDQFERLEGLLEEAAIPVTKWHGDASAAAKKRVMKRPQGIIQTTPESLESMLMHNSSGAYRLFSDLRFIIIDEMHYFMDNDRGLQLLCLLERLARLIGYHPRRIGLSATLGDCTSAVQWLNTDSGRDCIVPKCHEKGALCGFPSGFPHQGEDTELGQQGSAPELLRLPL